LKSYQQFPKQFAENHRAALLVPLTRSNELDS
jgi:hypothetical protein